MLQAITATARNAIEGKAYVSLKLAADEKFWENEVQAE